LIVVVVAAVASLSVFLTQAQANAQNREAYLTSVQDENLQVAYAQFYPNNPAIQWELDAPTGSPNPSYYVQMIGTSTVLVTQIGTPAVTFTENLVNGLAAADFNRFATGAAAMITTGSPGTIDFSGTGWTVNPATWTNVTVTVRNLNTAASGIYQIKVNDNWMSHWREVGQNGQTILGIGTPTSPALEVPAKSSITLNLTLSSFAIAKDDPLTVTILSSAGNFFSATYSPPVPVAKASTSTENYQVTLRDIVSFDASQSFSTGSTIQNYFWQIGVPLVPVVSGNPQPSLCNSSALTKPGEFYTLYASGQTVQYTPESLFTPAQLTSNAYCVTGPISATLVVVDGNGLMATSNLIVIPADKDIAPVGALSGSESATGSPTTVTVQVSDIFGRPAAGAVVLVVATTGDPSAFPASVSTNAMGIATFTVAWSMAGSAIELELGNLPPVELTLT